MTDSLKKDQVVAVLGCGFMGTALLKGILVSNSKTPSPIKKYLACVRRQDAADHLQSTFSKHKDLVEVVCGDNLRALNAADVVILGFRPDNANEILGDPKVSTALQGKLIVSMLAGVSREISSSILSGPQQPDQGFRIVRVIPSIGAQINESCSLISEASLPPSDMSLVEWIFSQVGSTQAVSEDLMDTVIAISATSHALTVTAVDALTDGSVSRGVPRSVAVKLVAQCLNSASAMLLRKMTLEELKDSMSVPKGITTEAWIHLDKCHVRSGISQSVRHAVDYAQRMV